MDNVSADEENVYEVCFDGAGSPDGEPRYENTGEARRQLFSEVQVHACAEPEPGSPIYMDIRDKDRSSSSSSSSSSSDEDKVRSKAAAGQKVALTVEKVNGAAHDQSRRSSSSSSSSASSAPEPVYDRVPEEDNAEDGMLMAYSHPATNTKQAESVDYSLKTLEHVIQDKSSAAPAERSQPDISLFVKVRTL